MITRVITKSEVIKKALWQRSYVIFLFPGRRGDSDHTERPQVLCLLFFILGYPLFCVFFFSNINMVRNMGIFVLKGISDGPGEKNPWQWGSALCATKRWPRKWTLPEAPDNNQCTIGDWISRLHRQMSLSSISLCVQLANCDHRKWVSIASKLSSKRVI